MSMYIYNAKASMIEAYYNYLSNFVNEKDYLKPLC